MSHDKTKCLLATCCRASKETRSGSLPTMDPEPTLQAVQREGWVETDGLAILLRPRQRRAGGRVSPLRRSTLSILVAAGRGRRLHDQRAQGLQSSAKLVAGAVSGGHRTASAREGACRPRWFTAALAWCVCNDSARAFSLGGHDTHRRAKVVVLRDERYWLADPRGLWHRVLVLAGLVCYTFLSAVCMGSAESAREPAKARRCL